MFCPSAIVINWLISGSQVTVLDFNYFEQKPGHSLRPVLSKYVIWTALELIRFQQRQSSKSQDRDLNFKIRSDTFDITIIVRFV